LTPDQITKTHENLTRRLNNRGISVYANMPLLGGVNDTAQAVHDTAYALRNAAMEFHQVYVAGLPLQTQWNAKFPVDSFDVIDMATKVRREGSGREIPRYIIATPLGEVDYGLTSTMQRSGDGVKLSLGCFDLAYYKRLDDRFEFPAGVEVDDSGSPVVRITGLVKTNDFPIS